MEPASDPQSLVSIFNNLPRRPQVPAGNIPNHWHFSLRAVPLNPPGSLLFLLQPQSRYMHVEGPIPPAAESQSMAVRANMYAMLLLKAFNSGLGAPASVQMGRPWTWSTQDAEVAGAVGEVLRGWGIEAGLEAVGVSDDEERKIADEEWERFFRGLQGLAEGQS